MSTDLDQRLAELRPEPQWSADERATLLDEVVRTDPLPQPADRRLTLVNPSRRGRRAIWAAGVAAMAAAACVVGTVVLPSGAPGSANYAAAGEALHQLAHIAISAQTDELGPGQYVHLVDVGRQEAFAGQPASDSRYEYWIRSDGLTYQKRTEATGAGRVGTEVWLTGPGPQTVDGMTEPVYLDQLPTEPAALETYLRSHTSGSTSTDERVFVAAVDIVRRAVAGPRLRSAAIEVLARLGHVRLDDQTRDSMGNPVRAFDFVDPENRSEDIRTIMFDRRTAQITEEQEHFKGHLFVSTTVPVFEIVDIVPASVREAAVRQD